MPKYADMPLSRRIEQEKADFQALVRDRKLKLIRIGYSVEDAKRIAEAELRDKDINNNREISGDGVEKRVICGKARPCKIVDGKIIKVYNSNSREWIPYDAFVQIQQDRDAATGHTIPIITPEETIAKRGKKEKNEDETKKEEKKEDEIKQEEKKEAEIKKEEKNEDEIKKADQTSSTIANYIMTVKPKVDTSKIEVPERVKIEGTKSWLDEYIELLYYTDEK